MLTKYLSEKLHLKHQALNEQALSVTDILMLIRKLASQLS